MLKKGPEMKSRGEEKCLGKKDDGSGEFSGSSLEPPHGGL